MTDFSTHAFGFSYDALGRRTQLTRANGVNSNYSYDALSRLLSVLDQKGTSTLDGATYTVDAAGNRTSLLNKLNAVTSNFSYDTLYELTQVTQGRKTPEAYTYDVVGNRLSSASVSSFSYNSSNELASSSDGTNYAYDANGNLLTKTPHHGGATSYAWDFENRLASVTLPGSGGTVTFKYGPFGRRIEKVSGTTTSIYVYDGDNALAGC